MFKKRMGLVSGVLIALACGVVSARAEIVTFEFAGSLGSIEDPGNRLQGQLAVGAPAFASLRFDTATPDFYPDDPGRGAYLSPGWLMFDVGGLKFERTTWVQVDVLHHGDNQELFQAMANGEMTAWPTAHEPGDFLHLFIAYYQVEPTFTMLESDAAPRRVNFAEASHTIFEVSQSSGQGPVEYSLRINMVPVPEPATWAVLGLGLAGVCWRARRR